MEYNLDKGGLFAFYNKLQLFSMNKLKELRIIPSRQKKYILPMSPD